MSCRGRHSGDRSNVRRAPTLVVCWAPARRKRAPKPPWPPKPPASLAGPTFCARFEASTKGTLVPARVRPLRPELASAPDVARLRAARPARDQIAGSANGRDQVSGTNSSIQSAMRWLSLIFGANETTRVHRMIHRARYARGLAPQKPGARDGCARPSPALRRARGSLVRHDAESVTRLPDSSVSQAAFLKDGVLRAIRKLCHRSERPRRTADARTMSASHH